MEQVGLVKKEAGDRVEVEIRRISSCSGECKTCSGCATPSNYLLLKNDINAKVGDTVRVKGEVGSILKYTMIVYMIPFAGLMLGVFLGMNLFKYLGFSNYEFKSFMIGLLTMGLAYLLVKNIDDRIKKKGDSSITMIEVIEE